jgi:histidine triad (HIT) family protein
MSSIFSKIIKGELPCFKVAEDDFHIAFLDISPVAVGHTLVIPKREIDYIFDMNDEDYLKLLIFSKRVAKALKASVDCRKIGMSVIGLEVPHAHVHLVPINSVSDMTFGKTIHVSNESMLEISELVKSNFY